MPTPPPISALMTRSPVTIDIHSNAREAQQLMGERRFRHLPVVQDGRPVGVLSDRDITLAIAAQQGLVRAEEVTVEDVCVLDAYEVAPDTPLDHVVATMAERHIGSVLVVDGKELVGIFTATDACRYLGQCLRGELTH